MEFQSVPAYVQQVVSGLILMLLVVLDRTFRTRPPVGTPIATAQTNH
jgi:ribose transport system permease protein